MRSHTRRPGAGPRQADRIYTAALELVGDNGFDALTIEGVAERSTVNKTTIYRWWPSKDALLADALINSTLLELNVPDSGSLRGDLIAMTARVHDLLTGKSTSALALAVFSAATSRPELAELTREFFTDRLEKEREVFARAIARGELDGSIDATTVVDMLIGAVWTRTVLRQSRAPQDFATQVVDLLLPGLAPRWPAGAATKTATAGPVEESDRSGR